MKKLFLTLVALLLVAGVGMAQKKYEYRTFNNDPMGVREYTLDNGLKVFMSVYKDAPKVQTYIAVRAGSKNDPKETTGLAHYLEHMMFKGTQRLGTRDWEAEKILIQQIEDLFEAYRLFDDQETRAAIYHKIDSLSYEASKLAIANEYDKAMTAIGSTGTNAFTSNDYTMYVENIPANQLDTWCEIEADRFRNLVLRLFHTELETIYEEKNMSLTKDGRRANEAMLSALFPHHPYGTQTTLGEGDHLKNPSMRNIRNFVAQYYVPNNICISLAGDFDPDEAIRIIDKHWGDMQPGNVPQFTKTPEAPITTPIVKSITGLDPENLTLAYRVNGGNGTRDALLCSALEQILNNGECGLIDLNLNQAQKCLGAYAGSYTLNDYTAFLFGGRPAPGQTLDQLQSLLFEQIELVKKGQFEDWMLEAAINNMKLTLMKRAESNNARASAMAYAYVQHQDWQEVCNEIDEISRLTKKDIVDFANQIFQDNNYVAIRKLQGQPESIVKVAKPAITPIEVGRDAESSYLSQIKSKAQSAQPIEPVFIDYKTCVSKSKMANGAEVLYVKNEENLTFNLDYYFDFGSLADPDLEMARALVSYLGTSKHTPEQIAQEFYKLACSYDISLGSETMTVSLSGLSENMEKAIALMEEIFSDLQPNQEMLDMLVARNIKGRADSKSNQQTMFSALRQYGQYGSNSSYLRAQSDEQWRALKADDLVAKITSLFSYPHRILYYGPESLDGIKAIVARDHQMPKKFQKAPANKTFQPLAVSQNTVIFCDYPANQTYLYEYNRSDKFDLAMLPTIYLYNEYFGGSMNAIVFQEMREKRSLAYSAQSYYSTPSKKDGYFTNGSMIATQNDKLIDALTAFDGLFEDMPQADANIALAKEGLIAQVRTARTTKRNLIFAYLTRERMGYKEHPNKALFQMIPTMGMQDVVNFNHKHIKGQHKTYLVLGKESEMDFNALSKFGKVKKVSATDLFNY